MSVNGEADRPVGREAKILQMQNELAEKRRKLQEMNRTRKDLIDKKSSVSPSSLTSANLDAFNRSYGAASEISISAASGMSGIPTAPSVSSIHPSIAPTSSTSVSYLDHIREKLYMEERERQQQVNKEANAAAAAAAAKAAKPPVKLSVARHILYDVPPEWRENYSKEVNTDLTGQAIEAAFARRASTLESTDAGPLWSPNPKAGPRAPHESPARTQLSDVSFGSEHLHGSPSHAARATQMSPAEVRTITSDPGFSDFLTKTSLLMERALNVNFDVIIDSGNESHTVEVGEKVRQRQVFFDEKWSKNKAITSLSFNHKQPELFLASYYGRQDGGSVSKSSGSCVCVWSLHLPQRAAYVYECQGEVTKAFYCKQRPQMIIGATTTGQIVLWDVRSGPDPVMRSPRTFEGHTEPVFGMQVVGTTSSHSLTTLSADGRLCIWGLDDLREPRQMVDLKWDVEMRDAGSTISKPISACTLAFLEQDPQKFFVGAEDGVLYNGAMHSGPDSVPALGDKYEGHMGPITGLHCHPNTGGTGDFGDLMLTCSMDWSCRLWTTRRNRERKYKQCLYSFDEYQEAVYDVQWSPVHPATFASVDGTGNLQLWHLGQTFETPISELDITKGHALNRLVWSPDGRGIAVGDARGNLTWCDVASDIAIPNNDDCDKMSRRIDECWSL
uniref:Guanine nucleotide-binding protein subunit beta-like protein n=1 Tax=Eutreptiella gymnastica TaxID=73025 RepID=A0A7S1JB51_9EUGL|mmetsp:Transcript_81451/g.143642  ORF Transcript_81451/g.143642 Transcript_81451/m.143642 type:complete len:672 (+) Transcript_81451:33-2048(+)